MRPKHSSSSLASRPSSKLNPFSATTPAIPPSSSLSHQMPHSLSRLFSAVPPHVPLSVSPGASPSESAPTENIMESSSIVSTVSTLISDDAKTLHTKKRASVLLSATLSRKPFNFPSAYKAVSTCSVSERDIIAKNCTDNAGTR